MEPHQPTFAETAFGKRFFYFGRNSGIHGLGHLFRENAHFLARLFWLVVVVASSGCLYLLLMPVVERGAAVSYTPDTRYLNWTTTFPAVTVCEAYSARAVQRKFEEHYPALMAPLNFEHKRYLTDLLFARGACSRSLCVPCGGAVPCDLPWRDIVQEIHKTCNELISECSYDDEAFPCCETFHQVDSEHGPCYSFNTLHENSAVGPRYFVNRTTGPGAVSFRLLSDAHVSVHSTEDLSTNNLDKKLKFDVRTSTENRVQFLFSVLEMENDLMLRSEDIVLRGCRYLHEVPNLAFHTYQVYSYGACRLARSTEYAFEHCGCVHPVRDSSYENNYCNYTGLNCLVNYEIKRTKLAHKHMKDDDCLPSCVESELTTIHVSRRWVSEEPGRGTLVRVQMALLPTLRYQRSLLRTDLDLVVSVGGLVGLFFSASILSLVEIFYLLFRNI